MHTVTEKTHKLAKEYTSDYWSDIVSEVGLKAALTDLPEKHDEDLIPLEEDDDEFDDSYSDISGIPLRDSLRIDDTMFDAMIVANENVERKVKSQYDDSLAPGANKRYDEEWSKTAGGIAITQGPLSVIASCQGGDEADMIFMHPIHGIVEKLDADEYRARTAPYIAAFGVEVFPGDLDAGLVHENVVNALQK